MLPLRLTLKNFLAYRYSDEIHFEGIHLACLTGQNGAGKSSLLDAITWVLWGKARASRDDELIHHGQKEMSVQLDFMQSAGDQELVYRVIRKRKGGSTSTLDLFIMQPDGSFKSLSEPGIRQTQQVIESLLRMSYETFIHSAFLQQGKADAFTMLKPAERKQILAEILELDRWADYENAAKAEVRRLADEIREDEARIADIHSDLKREPDLQRDLENAQARHAEALEKLKAAQARLQEVEYVRRDLPAKQDEKKTWDNRIKQIAVELGRLDQEIAQYNSRIAALEKMLEAQASIESGYQQLIAARSESDALSEKLAALSDLDKQRNTLTKQLDEARAAIEKQIAVLDHDISTLDKAISQADIAQYQKIADEVRALEAKEELKAALEKQIGTLETNRAVLSSENANLHKQMKELRDRIDRLGQVEEPFCPLCGQELTPEHRDQTIAKLESEGRGLGDTYRGNETSIKETAIKITAAQAELEETRVALSPINEKRRSLTLLKNALDRASEAQSQRDEKLAQRMTLHQQLEDEAYGSEIRLQIAALDGERESLGYDSERHESARETLKTYREYEQRYQELQVALQTLPDARANLVGAHGRRRTLVEEQDDKLKRIEILNGEIAALQGLMVEFNLRQNDVQLFTNQEREANNIVVTCEQELKALEKQRERLVKLESRLEASREERGIYEELRAAFGKKGIPAMIIESVIPELEDGANRLLSRMTDGRMTLKIETLAAKVTGGESETLEIKISDELGTRSYEMYSGGEAFRINFALRVALSQLLARRAGAQLRTLFLDEGFGTQDDDGRSKLVEAITAVQDDFDLILVITHIDDLRDSFPVHLQVEKTDNGSMVTVR